MVTLALLILLALLMAPWHPGAPVGAQPGGQSEMDTAGQASLMGDVNCGGTVDTVDSLQILRLAAGLSANAACMDPAGDADCDGDNDAVDSLRILRHVAGLSNTTPDGCTPIGEPLEAPPTSEALIAAALDAGDITYEESLRYRAWALYDLPQLPDEYRSPIMNYHAANYLIREVQEREGELSQELLNDLKPFLVRPNDPASIFNNPPVAGGSASEPAAAPVWVSLPAAGGAARVWVKDGPGAQDRLKYLVGPVTEVWNALPGIFRYGNPDQAKHPNADINPDTAIDLYFVDAGDIDPRNAACVANPAGPYCSFDPEKMGGFASPAPPDAFGKSSGYVVIDNSTATSGDELPAAIAHELAHVGQFAYDKSEPWWLKDSTADWVAFKVLTRLGLGHWPVYSGLDEFFDELDQTLTRDKGPGDSDRYHAWVFHWFLSLLYGDAAVTQIWDQASAPGIQNEKAVNSAFPFAETFDDFSVQNWNQLPVDPLYKDFDSTFPPWTPNKIPKKLNAPGEEQRLDSDVLPLAARYYSVKFDLSIRTVVFENKLTSVDDAHVWAIKKIGTQWKEPENWTREARKEFCRDDETEDVTELVIIISNADMKDKLEPAEWPVVKGEAQGCSGWRGTAHSTITRSEIATEIITNDANIVWKYHDPVDEVHFSCETAPDPCQLFLATGTINWTYSYTRTYGEPCTEEHSGTVPAGNVVVADDQHLLLQPDGAGGFFYSGVGFDPTYFLQGVCEIPGWYDPIHYFQAPETQHFRVTEGGKRIVGSYSYPILGGMYEYEWDFHLAVPVPP